VNDYTTGDQTFATVLVEAGGGFVVAWTSNGSPGTDSSVHSVQARRYAADGFPVGGQFQVNSYTTGTQSFAVLADAGGGRLLMAWTSDGSSATDSSHRSVQAQIELFRDGFETGSGRWSTRVP
jgi:hypothetical protein